MTLSINDLKALNTLGERTKHLRGVLKLSQQRLGEMTGTSQAVIQKIENGFSKRPRELEKIAQVLGVSPQWLMFGNYGGSARLQYLLNLITRQDETRQERFDKHQDEFEDVVKGALNRLSELGKRT
jgi:transcriptional regulator with XRE-family HTH domain